LRGPGNELTLNAGYCVFDGIPFTHNSHFPQKPAEPSIFADIADSAYRVSVEDSTKLLEALASEDIEEWRKGGIGVDTLHAFARSLVQRRDMAQGKRPAHYTERATCKHCGLMWLCFSGEVLGCPWCWNRAAGKPMPRPCSVQCGECVHFERIDLHPWATAPRASQRPLLTCGTMTVTIANGILRGQGFDTCGSFLGFAYRE